jgi:hypothetical protein
MNAWSEKNVAVKAGRFGIDGLPQTADGKELPLNFEFSAAGFGDTASKCECCFDL